METSYPFSAVSILSHAVYIPAQSLALLGHDLENELCRNNSELDLSLVPSALRRRCSQASKIALSVAMRASENQAIDYAVFCSQHGEISHTLTLLEQIRQTEELSPSCFSQSVHNTASGLFTICKQLTQSVTSIAAGKNTFLAGMIEALTWLQLNPQKTVMVTQFDEAIPELYRGLGVKYVHEYGLALVLSNKKVVDAATEIQGTLVSTLSCAESVSPPGLDFFSWYKSGTSQVLTQSMGKQSVNWQIKREES